MSSASCISLWAHKLSLYRRRATGRHADSKTRIFDHLVKWVGYPVDQSTWEPEDHLKYQAKEIGEFMAACAEQGIPTRLRVTLLPEAKTAWDEEGDAKA
jgi:hypothetical protein